MIKHKASGSSGEKRKKSINRLRRRRTGFRNRFFLFKSHYFDYEFTTHLDKTMIILLALILGLSFFFMSTASMSVNTEQTNYLSSHFQNFIFGMVLLLLMVFFNYRTVKEITKILYLLICAVLAATLVLGTGEGANRWLWIFQPSEIAKLVMIVLFAAYLDKHRKHLREPGIVLKGMIYMAFPMFLIFVEPDLGTSLVFFVIMMVMLYIAGANRKFLALILIALGALVAFVFVSLYICTDGFQTKLDEGISWIPFLEGYQIMRLAIFVNPEMDSLGDGYHIIQSKIAIGSGGLFGKGYGNGTQVQSNFLPEHHTDFIFAVIGEEFGFVVSVLVLLLLMAFMVCMIRHAYYSQDFFGTLIISGITTMMMFQIFENIGMATGIMPVTGLPLPFFSYGGSSMLTNLASVGLVISISLRGKPIPVDENKLLKNRSKKIVERLQRTQKTTDSQNKKRRRAQRV